MTVMVSSIAMALVGRAVDKYSLDFRIRVAIFKLAIREFHINRRIAESNDNLLRHPRWTAFGHTAVACAVAATTGILTAFVSEELQKHTSKVLWHVGTTATPIVITATLCILWHTKGAPWLKTTCRTGVHAPYVPQPWGSAAQYAYSRDLPDGCCYGRSHDSGHTKSRASSGSIHYGGYPSRHHRSGYDPCQTKRRRDHRPRH